MNDTAQANSAPAPTSPAATSGSTVDTANTANLWATGNGPVIALFAIGVPLLLGVSFALAWGLRHAGGNLSKVAANIAQQARASGARASGNGRRPAASVEQSRAEALLARAASGDVASAQQVLSESSGWTGRTSRTPRSDQLVMICLYSRNFDIRDAGIAAVLAFDGVPRDATGLARAEQAAGNPNQRLWALWTLGALANRGVGSDNAAKAIGSYLSDPDARTRATAVDGLSLAATDETVPILLDRFRNDPSPMVQESAARDLAEAGMYTHAQRMVAARSLVGWVGDASLSVQQRGWATHALTDIAGKSFGNNVVAWQSWYNQQSSSE